MDKQLIKDEIERRIENLSHLIPDASKIGNLTMEDVGYFAKSEALKSILKFINSLPEEPASEDLEEAALKYRWEHPFCDGYTTYSFKAGAEWQKKKDQDTIELAEDHALLAGMMKEREEMMKDAVEGLVCGHNDNTPAWIDLSIKNKPNVNVGDKVKIIIVKTEQQ